MSESFEIHDTRSRKLQSSHHHHHQQQQKEKRPWIDPEDSTKGGMVSNTESVWAVDVRSTIASTDKGISHSVTKVRTYPFAVVVAAIILGRPL